VVSDSTATVIGAMIIAPLMTPLLGVVLGVVLPTGPTWAGACCCSLRVPPPWSR